MRNKENWNNRVKAKVIKKLTPRLQHDLLTLPPPKNLPEGIPSCFIWGPSEYGKTVRAAFMLLEEEKQIYLEARNDKCVFVSVASLIKEIKDGFNDYTKSEYDVIDYYQNVHLLVLDDLGTLKTTDWVLETLYIIINYRYEFMKKTIYTSNKNLDDIAEQLNDSRITSRIERQCEIEEKLNYKK